MRRIYLSEDKKFIAILDDGCDPIVLELKSEKYKAPKEIEPDDFIEDDDAEDAEDDSHEEDAEADEYPPTPAKKKGYKCKKCGINGHSAKTCFRKADTALNGDDIMDLMDKVAKLKAKGLTSGEVAKQLDISIVKVNDLW